MRIQNPVIPGFYPDPSICRVGEDYYLVTSSFEYFPGVPVFHSRDLVHWEQIGHCLTRPEQLPLQKAPSSGGIFAPTLRYHQGKFYLVTTNTTGGGHFFVTADHPAGDWSDPIWIDEQGIDPSFLFGDGKVYFHSTGGVTPHSSGGIYQSEIDLSSGRLLPPKRLIWTGTGGQYPEAPHLYKISGRYYLMIAEGGTEYGHMITLARSDSPWGPFESCPYNPILSHRSSSQPIQATGHGDIVETPGGTWWIVFLGIRPVRRGWHHLGRETFLAPITWTDDHWFTVNEGEAVPLELDVDLPVYPVAEPPRRDDFDAGQLGLAWNFLRNPYPNAWSLAARQSCLTLHGSAVTLDDVDSPAWVGRRQQHFDCTVQTLLEFDPRQEGEEAGLTAYMNERHHYEMAVVCTGGERHIILRRRIGSLSGVVASEPLPTTTVILTIRATPDSYSFGYQTPGFTEKQLGQGETRYLSQEVAGGFTGVYFALYATGSDRPSTAPAHFDWFDYIPQHEA
jgi:xylan 1,4-beta-xylosidase